MKNNNLLDRFERAAQRTERMLMTEAQHATTYRVAAAEWVKSIIRTDTTHRWYPFILSSIRFADEVADRADYYRRVAVIRASERATKHLLEQTRIRKVNPRRQRPEHAVRVIYLPAVKGKSVHLHGWCAIPHTDTHLEGLVWNERNARTGQGLAPSSLVRFSINLCGRLATKNIWWNLGDDRDLGSVDYALRVLTHEKREWGLLELQPAYLFNTRTEVA